MNLPHRKSPCKNCPFRKDSMEGWLGESRMDEILKADSFVCHKNNELQCSGHMILNKESNSYFFKANQIGIDLKLKNEHLIFDTKKECINHHKY